LSSSAGANEALIEHRGGCHCGRVRFAVAAPAEIEVSECNCSICQKRGALWAPVPAAQFSLMRGQDALADYQFNRKKIHHLFCESCGIGSFSRGTAPNGQETVMLNVRCLDGVDVDSLKVKKVDGRSY
jgi:hypothetical protein